MRSRLASLTAAGVLGVSTALAQPAVPAALTRVDGPAMTIGQALARLSSSAPAAPGFAPKVIQLETADSAFLIPAAGSVQGAGNTYYRSDFMAGNTRSSAQRIGIGWIAQGVDNSSAPLDYFSVPANQFVSNRTSWRRCSERAALGRFWCTAQRPPNNDIDVNGSPPRLLPDLEQPAQRQRHGLAAVSGRLPQDAIGSARAYALGLRHDAQYRTNVGIVNLDSVSHTWTVRDRRACATSTTFNVTVLPYSMKQTPLPSGNYGDLFLDLQTTGSGFWSGYGASVDNITGDGWVARALQP